MTMLLLGAGPAAPGGAWTPASDASRILWVEPTASYVNGATNGGALTTITARFPNAYNLTRTGAGPTWDATNACAVMDGANWYTHSGVTANVPLTIYAIGVRAAGKFWAPLATANGDTAFIIDNADTIVLLATGGTGISPGYTGSAGKILVRLRFDATGHVYCAATGMAEIQVDDGTGGFTGFGANLVGADPGTTSDITDAGQKHGPTIITGVDTTAGGGALNTNYLAYLNAQFGVSL